MKIIKPLTLFLALPVILLFTGTHLTSCQKETIYDTIIKNDTIRISDTIHVTDTIRITDTCNCYNLKDGLVAYYNFNGGNLDDSSGKNNNIIFNNATKTADRFGRPNNAYLFNGAGNYMKVTNHSSLNPEKITLMATVKLNGFYSGLCNNTQILKKGYSDQSNGIYGLRTHEDTDDCSKAIDVNKQVAYGYYGNASDNSVAYDPNIFVKTGEWKTYVYTYDGEQSKFYINGVLVGTTNNSSPFSPNTSDLFIGRCEHPSYPYWFNGIIDEVRIYNRAICETEVKMLQNIRD